MAGIGIGFNTMGNYESATQYGASTPYLAPGCYEGGAGYAMMFMAQRVEKYEKGKIIYSTSVTDLIKDESGRVVGFHAKGENGASYTLRGKAVCLALAAVFCVAADQAVKFLVVNTMSPGESEPLLPPLLQLTRVHNYGAAWSSFSGARWLLIALTAAGMCAIAWLLVKIVRHPLGQWSLAIILGGGIGNLIDRVRLGYVVDMLDTMFMDFPVFNVADVFVVCGTVCALIYYLAFYSKSDEKNWGNKVDGTDPAANK